LTARLLPLPLPLPLPHAQDGYFKVARGKHDCGISSDPMVVLVEESAVVPGAAEALRAKYAGLHAA
jgi:hypothetical protein